MTSTNMTQTNAADFSWLEAYRHITVIGLGMSGIGVVKVLAQYGFELHIQDSRENPTGLAMVRSLSTVQSIHTGSFDQVGILASDLLILSPGVSLQTPEIQQAMQAGIDITSDIDIVSRSSAVPIIAITGSNGKSTVTQLAGEICQAAGYQTFIGGNIGRSAMELLEQDNHDELAVLELSSFQLDITPDLGARSAVVLNLSPDHLDRYAGFQEYAMSKLAIYRSAATLVWNRNDEWLQNVELFSSNQSHADMISFGLDEPQRESDFGILQDKDSGQSFFAKGSQALCATESCTLIGTHNQMNVLAAIAVVSMFDIDQQAIKTALENFQGLPHRMQKVRELNGVVWINDSKATNVGATQSALAGLEGSIILIAGGQGKGADFNELLPQLNASVKQVFLLGEDASEMYAAWSETISCSLVSSLEQAVQSAFQFAESKDTVLLAPACASFDMFPSFVARGECFIELVNAL